MRKRCTKCKGELEVEEIRFATFDQINMAILHERQVNHVCKDCGGHFEKRTERRERVRIN